MPSQADQLHTINREAMRQRHNLGEALLTADAEEYVVSLHHQNGDGRLWCIKTHGKGETMAAGGNPPDLDTGWVGTGEQRVLFGTVPPDTKTVWVATDCGGRIAATTEQGVFCAIVAISRLYLITFHDQQGRMLQAQPLVADDPKPPSLRSRCVRWLTSLRIFNLPQPRYIYTYGSRPQRNGK